MPTPSGTTIRGDAYRIAGITYQEAAAYIASFIAYVTQRSLDHEAVPVQLDPELSEHDRRVLQ